MHSSCGNALAVPLRQPLHDFAVDQVALPVQASPADLILAALSHADWSSAACAAVRSSHPCRGYWVLHLGRNPVPLSTAHMHCTIPQACSHCLCRGWAMSPLLQKTWV